MATDQEILDAIDSAISGTASAGGVKSYTINGRSVERMSIKELMEARGILQARISRSRGGILQVARPRRPIS